MKYLFYFIVLVVLIACKREFKSHKGESQSVIEKVKSVEPIPYNFDKAESIFVLDADLNEISGLDFNDSNNSLIAHNDEEGYFFELTLDSGKIIGKTKFAGKGDYEGIAYRDPLTYITKHTGKIIVFDPEINNSISYKTPLTAMNDVEGLCFDKINDRLLLACKGQPLLKKKHKNQKCIYAFDLKKKTLVEDPILSIRNEDLIEWTKMNYDYSSKFDLDEKVKRIKEFSPSGISFTNDQNDLYLISARGSSLLVFDNLFQLSSIHFLNSKTLPQPEGICFDKYNNLYVSTEGHGFSGKIFKYKHHEQY